MESKNQDLVDVANEMLDHMHTEFRVSKWQDINHRVFVTLYEGLCAETLKDKINFPRGPEEEAHNIQAVIDAISMDIVNASLSHITGEDIVRGDTAAMRNLLDVFSWMLEYILERISHDGASERDLGELESEDDPDRVTSDFLDEILEKELTNGLHNLSAGSSSKRNGHLQRPLETTADYIALGNHSTSLNAATSLNNTADLIALGNQSPPKRGPGGSSVSRKRSDKQFSNHSASKVYADESTELLIRESEELERRIRESTHGSHQNLYQNGTRSSDVSAHKTPSPAVESHTSSPPQLPEQLRASLHDENIMASTSAGLASTSAAMASTSAGMASTYPGRSAPPSATKLHATVPNPQQHQFTIGTRRTHSYESLTNMVQDTVSMSRAALGRTSPKQVSNGDSHQVKGHRVAEDSRKDGSNGTESGMSTDQSGDVENELSNALRKTLKQIHKKSEEIHNVSSLQSPESTDKRTSPHSKVDKSKRKVSFLTSRSSDEVSNSSRETTRNISNNAISKRQDNVAIYLGHLNSHRHHYPNEKTKKTMAAKSEVENEFEKSKRTSESATKSRALSVAEELYYLRQGAKHSKPDPTRMPRTFNDYLEKYYGVVERRDYTGRDSDDEDRDDEDEALRDAVKSFLEESDDGEEDDDSDDDVVSQSSDTAIDYRKRECDMTTGLSPGHLHKRLNAYGAQGGKSVKFDDAVDEAASSGVDGIRKTLAKENTKKKKVPTATLR